MASISSNIELFIGGHNTDPLFLFSPPVLYSFSLNMFVSLHQRKSETLLWGCHILFVLQHPGSKQVAVSWSEFPNTHTAVMYIYYVINKVHEVTFDCLATFAQVP